jgi:Domain of unknown function (DUF1906)
MPPAAVTLAAVLLVLAVLVVGWWVWQHRRGPVTYGLPVAYGLDFSWSRPSIEAMLAAGYTFVCRYLSWSTTGKNLTRAEADSYRAAGIDIVSNWEYYADAALGGYWQGVDDATEALRQHAECGGGPDDPIYFSVDWDAQSWQWPAIADYFDGIASVLPLRRIGAYGGVSVIAALFDTGLITYGWQTYAWSYGRWDPRAQLRQVKNGIYVGGQECDRNEAWAADFGAWGQSVPPPPEGDGTVLLNAPFDPGRVDLFWVGPGGEVFHRWGPGDIDALWAGAGDTESLAGVVVPGTLTAAWTYDAAGVNLAGLGAPDDAACPYGSGQYWAMYLDRSGVCSGWGSLPGVYGPYPDMVRPQRATT